MKSNIKDLFLVIVSLIGLYLLFEISQNGRYEVKTNNVLLDTRNGKMYLPFSKGPKVKGEPVFHWELEFEEVK